MGVSGLDLDGIVDSVTKSWFLHFTVAVNDLLVALNSRLQITIKMKKSIEISRFIDLVSLLDTSTVCFEKHQIIILIFNTVPY